MTKKKCSFIKVGAEREESCCSQWPICSGTNKKIMVSALTQEKNKSIKYALFFQNRKYWPIGADT